MVDVLRKGRNNDRPVSSTNDGGTCREHDIDCFCFRILVSRQCFQHDSTRCASFCVGDKKFDEAVIGSGRDDLRACIDDELSGLAEPLGLEVRNVAVPQITISPEVQAGLDAIGWYHERKDEERNIGLGPEHDWSSHGADAFGLMAVAAETIMAPKVKIDDPYKYLRRTG